MDRTPGIRPRPSLARQLDIAARYAFPATTTLLLLLVAGMPLNAVGQVQAQISVAVACVFFWSLFRPASMPPFVAFLIGLMLDLLTFAPPGVNVLGLLIAHGAGVRFRRTLARQGFLLVWLAFACVAAVVAALQWVATAILTFQLLPAAPACLQAGLGAGLYPILATWLTRAHRTLAEPARA